MAKAKLSGKIIFLTEDIYDGSQTRRGHAAVYQKTDADPRVPVSFDQKKEALPNTKDSTDSAARPSFQ